MLTASQSIHSQTMVHVMNHHRPPPTSNSGPGSQDVSLPQITSSRNGNPKSSTMGLTPFDQIMLRQITRFLLCFKINPDVQEDYVLDVLRQGLAKTIRQIPFLSGSVRYGDDRNSVSVVFEEDVEVPLRVVRLHDQMPEYNTLCKDEIPSSTLREDLLSPLPNFIHPKTRSQPVFTIQANLLRGGLILCVCVHHSAIDGVGQGLLMTAFSSNCALVSDPSDALATQLSSQFNRVVDEIHLRRDLFINIRETDIFQGHRYEEYHIPDPSTVSPIDNITVKPCTARLFFFSDARIQELRKAILDARPSTDADSEFSTHDALGALAWHCVSSARVKTGKLSNDQTSKLVVPIDCRNHLASAGLPSPYLGNACICLMPSASVSEIVSENSPPEHFLPQLNTLARYIRSSVNNLSTPYLLGLAHHANTFVGDINTMKPLMQSYLGPDITYVSWAGFKLHDLNFGTVLGTMDYFRCPYRALDGVVKILPRGRGSDWEVIVEMEVDVMQELLSEQGQWMKWVDHVTF